MGKFRESSYHSSVIEFEHNGFVLHQKTMKVLDALEVDLDVLCNILESEDIDARKYALEAIKPTKTLYNYLKGKIESTRYITYATWNWGNGTPEHTSVINYKYSKYIKAIDALREYGKHRNILKNEPKFS